jgi:HSP20 family molecular chaperone IbpA
MSNNQVNSSSGDRASTPPVREVAPPVDLYENDTELLIVADVPGVAADDFKVRLDPPELVLEGSRNDNGSSARFVRAFRIGEAIDPEGISAELANGVLKVRLKKSQAARPRTIAVRSS